MASFFDHPYYKWNKMSLTIIGNWPEQSLFLRCLIPTFICANVISMIIPEIYYLKIAWPDLDAFLEWLAPILVLTMASVQLLNGSFQHKKFSVLLDHIYLDWKRLGDSPNVEVLRKHASRGCWITKTYFGWMYSACICYLMMPLVTPMMLEFFVPTNGSGGKIYLFNAYYGVNSDDYYFLILVHMFWESWVPIIVLISSDAMFFVYVEHACALFEIVEENLKRVGVYQSNLEDSEKGRNFKIICGCIDLHREAIIFTNLIESAYTISMAVLLGGSLLALSATELQVMNFVNTTYELQLTICNIVIKVLMHLNEPGELIRFGSFSLAQIFHLYLNSVPGQKIMDHSLSIFNCAYSVNWHDLTPRVQKLLILIMIRSLRPCQITAGKIYLITMENYSAIMQTSMSFFTVLSSMR